MARLVLDENQTLPPPKKARLTLDPVQSTVDPDDSPSSPLYSPNAPRRWTDGQALVDRETVALEKKYPAEPSILAPKKSTRLTLDPDQSIAEKAVGMMERVSPLPKALPDTASKFVESVRPPTLKDASTHGAKRIAGDVGAAGASFMSSLPGAVPLVTGPDNRVAKSSIKASEWWRDVAKEMTPDDANVADYFVQGLASTAPYFVTGLGIARGFQAASYLGPLAAKLAPYVGSAAAGVMEASQNAADQFMSLREQGMDDNESAKRADSLFWGNVLWNAALNKAGGLFDEKKMGAIKQAIFAAAPEGLQEWGQEVMAQFTGRNKKQDFDLLKSALSNPALMSLGLGTLIGGVFGAGEGIVNSMQPRTQGYSGPSHKWDGTWDNPDGDHGGPTPGASTSGTLESPLSPPSAQPLQPPPEPMAPPPSAITPADLPSNDLSAAVATKFGPEAQVFIPSLGPQAGVERIAMAAKKLSDALSVTPQTILDALTDASRAGMAQEGQEVPALGLEVASNAAFFARLPLREILYKTGYGEGQGFQNVKIDNFIEALKAGDPAATKEFMDKFMADPALAEAFPRPVEVPPMEAQENIKTPLAVQEPTKSDLNVVFHGKSYPVSSLQEASEKYRAAITQSGVGASESGGSPSIIDKSGKQIGFIAYNGKVFPGTEWESGLKPLYDPASLEAAKPRKITLTPDPTPIRPSKPHRSPREDYSPTLQEIVPIDPDKEGYETVSQFVRRLGKINPTLEGSEEIYELENPSLINTRTGKSLARMAASAREAGYLPEDSYDHDLIDLLKDEMGGKKHYPPEAYGEIETRPVSSLTTEQVYQAIEDLIDIAQRRKLLNVEMDTLGELRNRVKSAMPVEEESPFPTEEGEEGVAFADQGAKYGNDKNLVAMHNLSAENLIHADKIGGLAVPSISIGKKEHGFDSFGEITLVASPEIINPQRASTKVFNADIYSPRYPTVHYSISSSELQKIKVMMEKESNDLGRNIMSEIDGHDFTRKGLEAVKESTVAQLHYLRMKGETVKIPVKKAETNIIDLNPAIEKFIGDWRPPSDLYENKEFLAEWKKAQQAEYEQEYDKFIENGDTPAEARKLAKYSADLWYEKGKPNYNIIRRMQEQFQARSEDGKPDYYAAQSKIRDAITRDGKEHFNAWVDRTFKDLVAKERIPDGEDKNYNRKYLPHTLENVVRVMRRELQSGEGFNYGLGNLRASVAKRYRTIKEIQGDRDKVLSPAEFKKAKEFTDNEFDDIIDEAYKLNPNADNAFGTGDRFINVLIDGIKHHNIEGDLKEYGFGGMDVGRIKAFLDVIRDMPSEYFEAKLQRSVAINEFSGAAIPRNTPLEVKEILNKHGIEYVEYDRSKEGDRARAISEIGESKNVLFERGPEFGKPPQEQFGLPGMPSPEMPGKWMQAKRPQVAPEQLLADLEKAREIQGDLPMESTLAKPMTKEPQPPPMVAESYVTTKLVEDGFLDTVGLEYTKPEDAVAILYHLKNDTRENLYFLLLDKGNKIIGIHHNSVGTINSANLNMRQILEVAKTANASKIIPVHNHPSGNVKASADDIKMTALLRQGAGELNIEVGEHVIIDHGEYGVIGTDNMPSQHHFVEPKERPLKVRLLKLAQERGTPGLYQGRAIKNSLHAVDVMKELIDKNKNTLYAMILDNQLKINAITPLITAEKYGMEVIKPLMDAIVNHAGAKVVLVAHKVMDPGLMLDAMKKIAPLGTAIVDMVIPNGPFNEYVSIRDTNPEYFKDLKVGESTPEKKELIEDIKKKIILKSFTNTTVMRLRKSLNIQGALAKADMNQLTHIRDLIAGLQKGDSFLSDKQLAAFKDLLSGIERPDITPKRIIIDQFGEKSEIMSGPITGKIVNEIIPTVDIKEGHPMVARAVNNAEQKLDYAIQETSRRDKNFETMLSKAEASRAKKLTLLERIRRKVSPQNKEIFEALSGLHVDLTPEEAGVVAYLRNFFKKAKEDLKLEKYRKNYVTHMEKPLLEKIMAEGLVDAVAGLFKSDKALNLPINIMLELDNIIGGTKFFKYALERKGYGKPTTNLRQILHGYSTLYETKKALDQVLPEGQAIVQLLLKNRSAKWMKTFLQNLKGRGMDFNFRFGKMGWLARLADEIVTLGYYKLLGLNHMSALKNIIAGEANSFIYQSFSKYLTGKLRFSTSPKKVYLMAQQYGIFDGTYVDYAQQGIDKLRKLGDLLMVGQKVGEVEIRASLFAAELTPQEFQSGEITPVRTREIKDVIAVTQGIFSKTESPLFLQTWYGRALFQMNRWRITNAMLFRRLAIGAKEEVNRGNYAGENMRRLAKMFILYGLGMYLSWELEKAGYKKLAQMSKAMAESVNSIVELGLLIPIYKSLRDNPTFSILGEFVFTIQELAAYVGVPGIQKPKKVEFRKGIEDTYIAPIVRVKEMLGMPTGKQPRIRSVRPPSLESLDRRMDRALERSLR